MLIYFGLTQYCFTIPAVQKLFFKPLFDFKMYENKKFENQIESEARDFEEIPCETKTPEEPPSHRNGLGDDSYYTWVSIFY